MALVPLSRLLVMARQTLRWMGPVYGVFATAFVIGTFVTGCSRKTKNAQTDVAASVPKSMSTDCRTCSEADVPAGAGPHHARAHGPVEPTEDADALVQSPAFSLPGVDYQLAWSEGRPEFAEKRGQEPAQRYTADFVLGYTPL